MIKRVSPEKQVHHLLNGLFLSGMKGLGFLIVVGGMVGSIAGMVGCSGSSPERDVVTDYVWRLSIVLETEFNGSERIVITYPEKRAMTVPVTEQSIDLLDFLALTGCDLQVTAGYRNSGLGRVMPDSQQFLYQWRFIQESQDCLTYLKAENDELYSSLMSIVAVKRQEFQRYSWLSFWGGPEVRRYFGVSQQWLSMNQKILLSPENFGVLMRIFSMKAHDLLGVETYEHRFETALAELLNSNVGGQMLMTVAEFEQLLQKGTAILSSERANGLCPQGKPTKRAKILRTVFEKFYIGKVQPYLSFIHRQGDDWWRQQEALYDAFTFDQPNVFQTFASQYLDSREQEGLWQSFQSSQRAHTKAWQTLFTRCGMMPK